MDNFNCSTPRTDKSLPPQLSITTLSSGSTPDASQSLPQFSPAVDMNNSITSAPKTNRSHSPQLLPLTDQDNSNGPTPHTNKNSVPQLSPTIDMDTSNRSASHVNLVYYAIPRDGRILLIPTPLATRGYQRSTAQRHHLYARPQARPDESHHIPSPITPPQRYDPIVGIHPPLSPREIHRRQQIVKRHRLIALFGIPQFFNAVRNGWDVARAEERRNTASTSTAVEDGDPSSKDGSQDN
ncbi:hypothetical protein H0H92_001145 [Tricholoma furcatifolium]|nr:hypothetical protein H0H92_001145 [Tricholoma furcatifolium]